MHLLFQIFVHVTASDFKPPLDSTGMVQYSRSSVNIQFSRARFPNLERQTPSAISKLSTRKFPTLHRHQSATTPQPQAPDTLHQKLAHTLTRRAARIVTSAVRYYHPNVSPNSSSGFGSGATPYRAIFEHA